MAASEAAAAIAEAGRETILLAVQPDGLEAPWRITGADGYVKYGRGSRRVHVPVEGSYVVAWLPVPGMREPCLPIRRA